MRYYSSFIITPENSLANRALAYGDGLFETMLCVNQKIPLFNLHWRRLEEGLSRLKINKLSKDLIISKIKELSLQAEICIVKLVVFRKDSGRGYYSVSSDFDFILSVHPYQTKPNVEKLTISSIKLSHQVQSAGLKHLSRLEQVFASQELIGSNYKDAIMLDQKKNVVETINKNIILIRHNNIYSPKLNKCGVYGVAIRWLESEGFKVIWKNIKAKNIHKYHAMMVCNSIIGFNKITQINENIMFMDSHDLINQIMEKWQQAVSI
jgi:4-amino-4-deoxychorismate lyase